MTARLLFDENLAPGLVRDLADVFPDSAHVRDFGLQSASDDEIWARAAADGHLIVTKDDDFRQRSFLFGFPPKVLWMQVGNCRRKDVAEAIRRGAVAIQQFVDDPLVALLVLTRRR